MDDNPNFSQKDVTFSQVVSDLVEAIKGVMESERTLLRTELQYSTHEIKKQSKQIAIFGALAMLGVFPLIAFLVLGLGRLLENNYWLSSLIIGVVFVGIGGLMTRSAFSKMKRQKIMPRTIENLHRTKGMLADTFDDAKKKASRQVNKLQKEARRAS